MSLGDIKSHSTTDIYTDLNGLQDLKRASQKDAKSALPEAVRQFESVMISMMIKNMRKTGMEDPIFNSNALKSYRDMYDKQLGMELAKGNGIGLTQSILRQLQQDIERQTDPNADIADHSQAIPSDALKLPTRQNFYRHYPDLNLENVKKDQVENQTKIQTKTIEESNNDDKEIEKKFSFNSPHDFVNQLWPLAEKAAKKLNVTPEVILSQAALETGWGQHIISQNNKTSFNLFNIKADQRWTGEKMEKNSLEFFEGKALRQKSDFRAYGSYADSFDDYVKFIQNNPRYKDINKNTDEMEQGLHDKNYILGLQKAGYATDPAYSTKVMNVLKSEPIQNYIKLASK